MKKIVFGFTVLILIVTACAPQTPTEPPALIIEQPDDDLSASDGLSPLELTVARQLAENLDLDIED
ncbi:MAG TPA: hypothetical protein VK851_06690, partial [Anaerolineales bacterium]|nr:hypothetical protein [Anaerolineales bacterium]